MCLRETCTSRSACTDSIRRGICGRVQKSRQVWERSADWSLAVFEGWEGGSCEWLGEAVAGVRGVGMCDGRGRGGKSERVGGNGGGGMVVFRGEWVEICVGENRNRSDKVIGVMAVEERWDVVCGGPLW